MTNLQWRFRKTLWPSQNIWTLSSWDLVLSEIIQKIMQNSTQFIGVSIEQPRQMAFEKFANFFVRIDILERLFMQIINSNLDEKTQMFTHIVVSIDTNSIWINCNVTWVCFKVYNLNVSSVAPKQFNKAIQYLGEN